MKGWNIAEMGHVVNVLPPIDISGGKTGDRFNMKNYRHATIIIQVGASAAAFTKILVNECDAASSGNSAAIPFKLYSEETAAGDTLGAAESVAAAGKTPSANDNIMYVIELDSAELSDGYNFVEVQLTNGANSVIASVVAVLSGARYAHDQNETVLS